MSRRIRNLVLIVLSLPVLIFYGLAIYPWDFSTNRGLGWMMLLVLYGVAISCLLSALICLFLLFRDEKKIRWLVVLAINLVPVAHSFLPMLIG